jgi:hypothetical protein
MYLYDNNGKQLVTKKMKKGETFSVQKFPQGNYIIELIASDRIKFKTSLVKID